MFGPVSKITFLLKTMSLGIKLIWTSAGWTASLISNFDYVENCGLTLEFWNEY